MPTTAIDFAAEELNARQEAVDAPQLKPTEPQHKTTIGLYWSTTVPAYW